jgi:hypothetical protein
MAPTTANVGFKDSASVLAFVSLTAVAIERSIEGFFTLISSRAGQWWPLSVVTSEFDTFEHQTNAVLGDVVTKTLAGLEGAKAAAASNDWKLAEIQRAIDTVTAEHARLSAQLTDVTTKLAKGSSRLARVGEIQTGMSATLHRAHAVATTATSEAQAALEAASDAADRASLIIASFQDNPARRIASFAIGAGLGMLLAGGVGLNRFLATLGAAAAEGGAAQQAIAGTLGIVLTGIVIGLGSAPTHEVVKALQAYKENRMSPAQVATLGGGADAGGAVVPEAIVPEAFGPLPDVGRPIQLRVRNVRRTS